MKQKLTIQFDETQKSVNASVKLEIEQDEKCGESNDMILKEAQRLMNEAMTYSKQKTISKL